MLVAAESVELGGVEGVGTSGVVFKASRSATLHTTRVEAVAHRNGSLTGGFELESPVGEPSMVGGCVVRAPGSPPNCR